MISRPIIQDIYVYKGRDFRKTYALLDSTETPIDLTGWVFMSQIRPVYGSDILIAQLNVSVSLELSTVTISLSRLTTNEIETSNPIRLNSNTTSTNMVWDLSVKNNEDEIYSLLTGKCVFSDTATDLSSFQDV